MLGRSGSHLGRETRFTGGVYPELPPPSGGLHTNLQALPVLEEVAQAASDVLSANRPADAAERLRDDDVAVVADRGVQLHLLYQASRGRRGRATLREQSSPLYPALPPTSDAGGGREGSRPKMAPSTSGVRYAYVLEALRGASDASPSELLRSGLDLPPAGTSVACGGKRGSRPKIVRARARKVETQQVGGRLRGRPEAEGRGQRGKARSRRSRPEVHKLAVGGTKSEGRGVEVGAWGRRKAGTRRRMSKPKFEVRERGGRGSRVESPTSMAEKGLPSPRL